MISIGKLEVLMVGDARSRKSSKNKQGQDKLLLAVVLLVEEAAVYPRLGRDSIDN